jgi:hypothetical protein
MLMASSDYSAPAGIQGSVSEVVKLVDSELRQLHIRRAEIKRRIRKLHVAVDALQEFAGTTTSGNSDEEKRRLAPRRQAASSPDSKDPQNKSSDLRSATDENDKSGDPTFALRRACRIALLESDEALCEQEIRARIVRRGSFPFTNVDFAGPAIARALSALAEKEEVCALNDGPTRRWQRNPHGCE